MKKRFTLIICISLLAAFIGLKAGFSSQQATTAGIFCLSVMGILLFWELRLSFVFFGAGLLLITRSIDLENLLRFASLDVILFLIGMMILVGMLNEVGLLFWITTKLLRVKKITGKKLFLLLMCISACFSSLMGEVASIIIMAKIIIAISDFFDIDPAPLLLSSVLATNIGSSGTVLGNPIGVLIAARGKLSFEDFLIHALPVTVIVLLGTLIILFLWFKKYIAQLNEKLSSLEDNTFFLSLISIPADKKVKIGIVIFVITLISIVLHHRLELLFKLEENTLLLMLPIVAAGVVMLFHRDKVRYYVENEVEWTSILFFLFLFALAGAVQYTGIADFFALKLIAKTGTNSNLIAGVILYSSGFLSSILDNTVVVASYLPMVQSLASLKVAVNPLLWAILFGACYGGNITVIGSTANIVAVDILESAGKKRISFLRWLKIGLVVGIFSMTVAYLLLLLFKF